MDKHVPIEAALALHQQGQLDQAEAIYKQILQTQPQHFDALQLLATIALQKNDFKIAIDLFDQALKINPDFADAHNNRGTSLKNLTRYEEALDSFDQALKINPNFAIAYFNRGNTLCELKRFEEALESYDCALKIKPDYVDALKNRGNVLHDLNRRQEAVDSYDRALKMAEKPLVSVTVCSFNQEKYIRECVESVLAQTYSPLEIIFSDDASSDSTADIIASCLANYKGPHSVTFMRHPHNLGDLARGNFVDTYRRTTGQFIVQFCGDDVMLPTMVEKMVDVWRTKHVSMVTVNAEFIDEDSRMMGELYRDPYQILDCSLETIAQTGVNDAIFGAGQGCTREVYESFDYPPPGHLLAGDIMFTFFACLLNGCEMISTPQMKYRIHNKQLSFSSRAHRYIPQSDLQNLVTREKYSVGHMHHAFYMRKVLIQCAIKDPVRFVPIKEKIEPLILGQILGQAHNVASAREKLYYDHHISEILLDKESVD